MLGLWMTYFLLVNWFVHSLNKIAVPVLEIPLGIYLAVQGAAIVFAVALFRLRPQQPNNDVHRQMGRLALPIRRPHTLV